MVIAKKRSELKDDIAIVGVSVDVPGARGVDAYWANLREGVESIRRLSEEELLENGETPQNIARKNYVPAAADLATNWGCRCLSTPSEPLPVRLFRPPWTTR